MAVLLPRYKGDGKEVRFFAYLDGPNGCDYTRLSCNSGLFALDAQEESGALEELMELLFGQGEGSDDPYGLDADEARPNSLSTAILFSVSNWDNVLGQLRTERDARAVAADNVRQERFRQEKEDEERAEYERLRAKFGSN